MKDLSKEEIEKLLATEHVGTLALTDGDKPYCIPIGFAYTNNSLYLTFYERGRKWDILQTNNNACFCVYKTGDGGRGWSSAMVEGKLTKITDLQEIRFLLEAMIKRSGRDPGAVKKIIDSNEKIIEALGVKTYKITISEMSGKTASSQFQFQQ